MIQHTLHCIKCVRGRSCGQRLSALIYGLWIIIILELWAPNTMLNFYNKPDLSWWAIWFGLTQGLRFTMAQVWSGLCSGSWGVHVTHHTGSCLCDPRTISSLLLHQRHADFYMSSQCWLLVGCWSAADCVQPHYTSDYVSCCWDQSHSGEWLVSLAPDKNRKPVKSKIHIPCFYRYQSTTDLFILFFSTLSDIFLLHAGSEIETLWD